MHTLSGNVYLSPNTVVQDAPVKMEIGGDDWKIIGYVKDVKLDREVEYEDVTTDYSFDSWKIPRLEKHTITAEFTYGPESQHLWTLLTGDMNGLSIEKPVERVKRLIHGPH